MNFLPPVKRPGLRIFSLTSSGGSLYLAISIFIWQYEDHNYLFGVLVSAFLLVLAYKFLKLKKWVFKLACAILLNVSIVSVAFLFPPFGDEVEIPNKDIISVFLIGGGLLFLAICIFYNDDFS